MRHTATAIEDIPDCEKCKVELEVVCKLNDDLKKYWVSRCPNCKNEIIYDHNPIKRSVNYD